MQAYSGVGTKTGPVHIKVGTDAKGYNVIDAHATSRCGDGGICRSCCKRGVYPRAVISESDSAAKGTNPPCWPALGIFWISDSSTEDREVRKHNECWPASVCAKVKYPSWVWIPDARLLGLTISIA